MEGIRPPGILIGREAKILARSAITARDIRSPKGYKKSIGYTNSSSRAGRPPEPLEVSRRNGRII